MLNLFLAVTWLILGVAWLSWHWSHPEDRSSNIVAAGWFAVLLALYNLARWWIRRSAAATRRAVEEAQRRAEDHQRPHPLPPPDPNFVFTDEED